MQRSSSESGPNSGGDPPAGGGWRRLSEPLVRRFSSLLLLVTVVITALAVIGILVLLSRTGSMMTARNAPLVHASMEIKYELSLFHLWLEELIGGDTMITKVKAWEHLQKAKWYTNAMITGGYKDDDKLMPLEDPSLRALIETTIANIDDLEEVAKRRLAMGEDNAIGSAMDQEFDALFAKVLEDASKVEREVKIGISRQLQRYRRLSTGMGFVVIVLAFVVGYCFHLYQRQRAIDTAKLRESEGRFRGAFKTAGHGMTILAPDGRYISVNPAFCQITGYSESELLEKDFQSLTHADDLEENLELQRRLLAGEIFTYLLEKRYIHKQGHVIWTQVNVSLVRDKDGKPVHVVNQIQDITARKLAEEELEKALFELNAIFDNASMGIVFLKKRKFVRANKKFEDMFGFTADELKGESTAMLYPSSEEYEELGETAYPILAEDETYSTERLLKRKDGSLFWTRMSGKMVDMAEVSGDSIWIFEDITERKEAEEALRESEEKLRRLIENLHEEYFIYSHDAEGVFTYLSPTITNVLGYTPDEFLTHYTEFLTDNLANEEIEKQHSEAALHGEKQPPRELEIYHKDGSVRTLEINETPIFDEHGNLSYFEGIAHDITERKATESQLRQALKMESMGQLTGGVAHDFNNLLAVIQGNLELLEEGVEGEERLREIARRALAAAERGAALTQRLLAFSRKQTLLPEAIDLNKLVLGLTDLLQRSLGETIEIQTVLSNDLWLTLIDPGQLENVLLNLAVNARDAMPEGGKLTIRTENVHLYGNSAEAHAHVTPGQYVLLAISDTGIGMEPEVLEKVYEPFFTTKEATRGSGLGLSMVYGFVRQSGGHVKIESKEAKGTTVKIYLPRTEETEAVKEEDRGARKLPRAEGETVLVVEDDPEVRALTVNLLGGLGYEVFEAEDGEAGLAALEKNPWVNLLLTDLVLPGGMGGRDLSEEVRRHRPDIKVLFMSGYTEDAIVQDGGLDGGVYHLQKPFRKAELAHMVRRALADNIV